MIETPLIYKCLGKARSMLEKVIPSPTVETYGCDKDPDSVSDRIRRVMDSPEPCMIARFGSTELGCVVNYLGVKNGSRNPVKYLFGKSRMWWWNKGAILNLSDASGFFPRGDQELVERFCELFLEDAKEIDLLGSWHSGERYLDYIIGDTPKVFLPYLEPYWSARPWTKSLEGKRILVVHPFAELIEQQYKYNRLNLFSDHDVLPEYQLETVKAVQSLGGVCDGFQNWFEALDYMKSEIDKHDYDICIIGCGAYGLHLAAHVKRSGKKAIHVGGATQMLFGVKGNRWEDPNYGVREWGLPYGYYTDLINEYWVRPDSTFRPANADRVEGACYW